MTTKSAGQGADDAQNGAAGEPGGHRTGEAQPTSAARQSFPGQLEHEAHGTAAGEPGGHGGREAPIKDAARQPSEFAGQGVDETQTTTAGEPGGHQAGETQPTSAARQSFPGQHQHEAHGTAAGEPGGLTVNEAHVDAAARQSSSSFAGHQRPEAHDSCAGEPGGQSSYEAQSIPAARQQSRSDGQTGAEAHSAIAVDAPGQLSDEAHTRNAGGAPSHSDGQMAFEAHGQAAVETAPGHMIDEAQAGLAGGDPLAGQARLEAHDGFAGQGADRSQNLPEAQRSGAAVRATITEIVEIGRQNSFAIRQRMRVKQATLSHIARTHFGYHTGLTEAERKHAMDAATKLLKTIEAGEDHPAAMLVHATAAAAEPWNDIEKRTEKALTKLARKLPAYAWVQQVRGFGDLSFARIIAETGDLSGYANPGKVWKRLGLAVFDNKAQRRTRDAEKAMEQGYSPRRRAVMWVAFDPVIRAQSVPKSSDGQIGDEGAVGAVGVGHVGGETQLDVAGPYRQLYDAKKLEYLARGEAGEEGWTKLHSDRAAKRYASKRLLRDLWAAWRDDIPGQTPGDAQTKDAGDREPEAANVSMKPTGTVPPRASRKRKT